jgi:hypothetical protein
VWLCLGIFGGERRQVIAVDHRGLVKARKI